jgi:hypothetical protein
VFSTSEQVKKMNKKYILGEPCPDCNGEGHVYVGSSIPDDEGYDTCPTCNGKGKLPTAEELQELYKNLIDIHCALDMANGDIEQHREMNIKLIKTLVFYADPGAYIGIGFFPDHPHGEFMEDFSDCGDLGRKPGKRARIALGIEVHTPEDQPLVG